MRAPTAPHRALFAAAAAVWSLAALWWAWRFSSAGAAPGLLPPVLLHGLLMSLGFMPLFIAGFAFTAAPRWLGRAPADGQPLALPAALAAIGWALLLLGDALQRRDLAAAALLLPALTLLGMGGALWRLAGGPWPAPARPSPHARALAAGLLWLGLCLALAAAAIALRHWTLLQIATRLGLWLGVGGVFALALQRLSPFLHSEGRRAALPFTLLMAGLAARCALDLAGLLGAAALALPLRALLALGFAALALLIWRDAMRPALAAARRTPLLAQLHLGYLWLGLSFALEAAAQLDLLPRAAALHALSLGFMATTLLAMVSRVTAVQQGRSQAVDALLWSLQGLLQALTLARLLGALWSGGATSALLAASAAGFALLALGWSLRYGPWLIAGRQRPTREKQT